MGVNMKKILLSGLVLILFSAVSAHAGLIVLDEVTLGSPLGSPESEAAWINDNYADPDVMYLWKTGEGPYSYINVQNFTAGTSFSADIQWDFTGSGYELNYVLLKSGQSSYTLYEVEEDQLIMNTGYPSSWELVEGDFDNAVSHISFFGRATSVPEPTSVLLLGLGLGAVSLVSRRFKR